MNAQPHQADPVDVLIVGAGISGIGLAAHMAMQCPQRSLVMLDRRQRPGGTWDLFRYPGIRSDSDMYTLGYAFEPWRDDTSIAEGQRILEEDWVGVDGDQAAAARSIEESRRQTI